MKQTFTSILASLAFSAVACAGAAPNIVVILADDFGRELLSGYGGQSDYQTPALDQMMAEGMRFTTCYATPMCAPSRVEFLTGRYSFRNYTQWGVLDRSQTTFPQLLKKAGYETAMAGKWHPFGGWDRDPVPPVHAGFDQFCSYDSQKMGEQAVAGKGNRFWGGTILRNGNQETLDRYGPEVFSDFLVDFMKREREGPFLAVYYITAMHRPFQPTPDHPDAPAPGQPAPKEWLGSKGKPENFEPMLRYADKMVGKILTAAANSKNTLVIFTADNGTDNVNEARPVLSRFMNQNVRGGKYFPTELGVNVPFIARWPGVIEPGQTCETLIDFTDVLPSLCDAADAPLPENYPIDGRSILPLFRQKSATPKPFIYSWGNYENNSSKYKDPANNSDKLLDSIRGPRFKYYSDGRLFDLKNDFLEKTPVDSPDAEKRRQELKSALDALRKTAPQRW